MPEKLKISQSLTYNYEKYKAGELCGEYIKLVVIEEKARSIPSEPMDIGSRFEYEALGNLNYYGEVPRVILTPTGQISKKQQLITVQAANFRDWMESEGNIKLESGVRSFVERDEYILSFMKDLVYMTKDGKRIVCDLKMSSNLGNAESEYGWHKDTLLTHVDKVRQMMTYVIGELDLGNKVDGFCFYVASSKDENKYTPFMITISEKSIEFWREKIHNLSKEIAFEYEVTGFTPMPGPMCKECPAAMICTKKDEKVIRDSYTYLTI